MMIATLPPSMMQFNVLANRLFSVNDNAVGVDEALECKRQRAKRACKSNEQGTRKASHLPAIHRGRRTAITHQAHSCIETVLKDTTDLPRMQPKEQVAKRKMDTDRSRQSASYLTCAHQSYIESFVHLLN